MNIVHSILHAIVQLRANVYIHLGLGYSIHFWGKAVRASLLVVACQCVNDICTVFCHLRNLVCVPQPPVALPTSMSLSNPQQTAQITVSYPTPRSSHQQQTQPQKQRVFTGVVNKLHDTFGFVDEDVFFQLR